LGEGTCELGNVLDKDEIVTIAESAMKGAVWLLLAASGMVVCGPPAYAQIQSNGDAPEGGAVPASAEAAYRDGEVKIDGRPDESAWRSAKPITQFVQGEPVENAPAEQPTEVRVLYDAGAIYVGAVMHDWQPSRIGDQLVRRDANGQYDYFEFSLDTNNDGRTGYRFRVSAAGVQRDVYLYDDEREDEAWNAVWQSAVHRDSTGWSAEIRIPLSQVRFNAADTAQSWGVNFSRRRLASNERTYFALESRVRHGKVSQFGQLQGLLIPRSARRLELRPYALAMANTGPAEAGDPFFDGSQADGRVGLDLRYGLGAGFTLDASFNPDFGQVEVDPAVINLTAFEVFFPERRPFFVEDARVFDFNLSGRSNQLFYSRRIGREPRGEAPDEADFEEVPSETTILTAAKLTGRSAGGLSLGALAAITGREKGNAYFTDFGQTISFPAEPPSQYGVLRLQQDLRQGATQFGGIVTGMHRNLPSDSSFDFLTDNAYGLGFDFEHNFGGANSRDWVLFGFAAGSYIKGSNTALIEIQESSNHFFQRPDATRLSVDSTATSLSGIDWRLQFERRSARHWTGAVWLGQITPGFEINDAGFLVASERLDAGARLSYQEISPGPLFRSYRLTFFTFQNWRHEALDDAFSLASWQRAHKAGSFTLRTDFEFLNYWEIEANARYEPELLSDNLTRGGPLMIKPAETQLEFGLETDRRKLLFLGPRVEYAKSHRGGHRWETGLDIGFRPTPSLEIRLQPQYATEVDPAQYVTASDNVGYEPTYGARYFFSDLKRNQFSVETRLNVAFNNKLTLQFFAQPLISAGDYLTYKQLAASESFDFDVFEEGIAVEAGDNIACAGGRTCVDDDDTRYIDWDGDGQTDIDFDDRRFNIQSLRLNAVLRWEYRPGSTVFFVWQQNRRDRVNTGTFDLGRDFDALTSIEPENVFIIKVNYWLGL
jgi:hypothetical protein